MQCARKESRLTTKEAAKGIRINIKGQRFQYQYIIIVRRDKRTDSRQDIKEGENAFRPEMVV